jgi:hypothetical protein
MPRTHQPCGTAAAYWRHLQNREDPCQEDRDAVNAYQEAHRQARAQLGREFPGRLQELLDGCEPGHNRRQDAELALAREHRARFSEIFAERKDRARV